MIETDDVNHNTGVADYFQKGTNPLNQTARGKLQSRRSKLNDEIIKELRIRSGAENLFRASINKKVKETVAVELDFINSKLQLLKEELADVNSKVDEYEHYNSTSAIPMISLGLKETKDVIFKKPLQDAILEHFHDSPDRWGGAIDNLEALRQAVRAPQRSDSGIELLFKYYNHLGNVDKRFYGGVQSIPLYFQWCDSLTGATTVQRTIGFERGSILFNIGALYTQIGTKQDRTATEGLDLTISYYQRAAGVFKYLRDRFSHAPSKDMQRDVLTMLELLMLSQSQECMYEKAILRPPRTLLEYLALAQESSMVAEMYDETRNSMYSKAARDALPLSWVTMAMVKANHYKALSHFYVAQGLLKDQDLMDAHELRSVFEKIHVKNQETRLQEDYQTDPTKRQMLSKAHLKEAMLLHENAIRDSSFCRQTVRMTRFQEIIKHARDRTMKSFSSLEEEEEEYLDVLLSAPRIKPLSSQCASLILPDFASCQVEDIFKELGPVSLFCGRREWSNPRILHLLKDDQMDYGFATAGFQPVLVCDLRPNGPAARQGVKHGDAILAVDGVDVKWKNEDEVMDLIKMAEAGLRLTLTTPSALETEVKGNDALLSSISSRSEGMRQSESTVNSSWGRKKTGDFVFLKSKTVKKKV